MTKVKTVKHIAVRVANEFIETSAGTDAVCVVCSGVGRSVREPVGEKGRVVKSFEDSWHILPFEPVNMSSVSFPLISHIRHRLKEVASWNIKDIRLAAVKFHPDRSPLKDTAP